MNRTIASLDALPIDTEKVDMTRYIYTYLALVGDTNRTIEISEDFDGFHSFCGEMLKSSGEFRSTVLAEMTSKAKNVLGAEELLFSDARVAYNI